MHEPSAGAFGLCSRNALPGPRALLALGCVIRRWYLRVLGNVQERRALKHLEWALGEFVSVEKGSCFLQGFLEGGSTKFAFKPAPALSPQFWPCPC